MQIWYLIIKIQKIIMKPNLVNFLFKALQGSLI